MFTVYVLFSDAYAKHYTGFTSNIYQRLLSHNQLGKTDWATRFRPWRIIFTKDFKDKKEAIKFEKWLKGGQGRSFIMNLPHNDTPQ